MYVHLKSFKYKSNLFKKTWGSKKTDDKSKWWHRRAYFHRCVLVPGLYCEVDGSSESNQVDLCLVKDGNLFTIFGEKREKRKKTGVCQKQVKGGFCMSINYLFMKCWFISNPNLFEAAFWLKGGYSSSWHYLLLLPLCRLHHLRHHRCHRHPLLNHCYPHPRSLLGGDKWLVKQ